MSQLHHLSPGVDHPAPLRDRASPLLVLFGLFAGPVAWSLQLLLSYMLIGDRCEHPVTPAAVALLATGGGVAIVLTLLSLAWSLRIWRRTQDEGHGGAHHGLTSGTGRTRFLGLCGIIASVIFACAAIFEMLVPLLGTPCPAI